jgi:energy-coupling factor transporter ATP-binding protein EcfA2
LFDEPETHLHPNLITEFMQLLHELLEITGSFAVLATHSAYVVREVPRSQVIILREAEPRQVVAITPRLKTLGADVGEISLFVFGDDLFARLVSRIRSRKRADTKEDAAALLEAMEEELATGAWMNLRRAFRSDAQQ